MRLVLDTNVIVSALIWGGDAMLDRLMQHHHRFTLSGPINEGGIRTQGKVCEVRQGVDPCHGSLSHGFVSVQSSHLPA